MGFIARTVPCSNYLAHTTIAQYRTAGYDMVMQDQLPDDDSESQPPSPRAIHVADGQGSIHCRDGQRLIRIVDDAHPLLKPARIALYEWTDYIVEFHGADELRVGGHVIPPLGGVFPLQFQNQLGLTTIQLFAGEFPLAPPTFVEVMSPKFPTVERHVAFLSSLLDDLFARAASLPFDISGMTTRSVSEASVPPTPLFTLHFLLQHQRDIADAIRIIEARPHRQLTDRPALVPIGTASEIDADVLLNVVTSPERWVRAPHLAIGQSMRGYAPSHVWQRLPEESLDTPENRFVLAFLHALLAATDRLVTRAWWPKVTADRRQTIQEMQSQLRRAVDAPMFSEVGEMQRIPAASRVLMRREGYRHMLGLWRLFNSASQPFFGQLQHAIDLRTVDLLYEMWCFYALIEEIQLALGFAPELRVTVSDEYGLNWRSEARFGDYGRLVYNQSIKGYSVWFRPDFLWYRDGTPEVAFDAKFRMTGVEWDNNAGRTTVKNDDLYKMHTYRDALRLRAAVVVYPGRVSRFWTTGYERCIGSAVGWILDGEVDGVGAVSLAPHLFTRGD